MGNRRTYSGWLAIAALLVVVTDSANAQTARTGGTANAQLLQQLQQLGSERTTLQAENAKMKKELDDLRKERDTLKKAQQSVDQRAKAAATALARSTSERDSTEAELKQTKDKMQELVTKFRETLQNLRQIETEGATAKQSLAARDSELKTCIDRNLALYKLNGEVLAHFEQESAWSRMARAEPFTRLKRTELENLVDDYKSKADDQRITPAGAKGAGSASSVAPAAATPSKGSEGQ